ncbi:MAG: glutamate--tRNA ligase [Erysipelotrichaceae bacterium]|nr:glutamate--tRNA ligase [Erysipelotrichaceae bacterium]
MGKIRTRFAPSPTGYMHIGNLRTALYAYLIAKKDNGDFLLRIEDTDQERQVEGATDIIYNTLAACKLKHDEGPDVGGEYGPYVQSERMKQGIYSKYAGLLVNKGKAHVCFCKEEDIQAQKEAAEAKGEDSFYYHDPCKFLSHEEVQRRMDSGESFVTRQNVDPEGQTSFDDEVYGTITVDNSTLDEMILLKSDGYPTYNFANVIDDHLMNITDVVRGNEYLSSTPKYNLIYEAFGWEKPRYIHCPPVMKDEQHKLSKRNGDASFQDLVAKGYLPEAILNYIALLGWSPAEEREIYSLEELTQAFDVKRINTSGAIFDIEKLKWMNGEYLRHMDDDAYCELVTPYIDQAVKKPYSRKAICVGLKDRALLLNDIPPMLDFIDELPEYDIDLYFNKKMKTNPENSLPALKDALAVLESLEAWDHDSIHDALIGLAQNTGRKNGIILYPVRVALSGKASTPGGAIELALVFGKEETLDRIRKGIAKLENCQ